MKSWFAALIGVAVISFAPNAIAQSERCGAYSFTASGTWAAARGYPDCEQAKQAATNACQKQAGYSDRDCLADVSYGIGVWFYGSVCLTYGNSGSGMNIIIRKKREELDAGLRKLLSTGNQKLTSCRTLVVFHSDDKQEVTSGRAF